MQAVAGAAWWLGVLLSPFIREATLGSLDAVVVAILDIPLFVGASALAAFGLRPAAIVGTAWTILVTLALALFATITSEAGWGVLLMVGASCGSVLALSLMLLGRVPTEWMLIGPFAFRPANSSAAATTHVAVTALQILAFWGLFLGVFPLVVTFFERRWELSVPFPSIAVPVGVVVFVLASALGLWSAAAMSTRGNGTPLPAAMPNRLVIAGPYRFVRNPMAMAGIVQGAAVGLMLSSWLVVVYAVAGSLVWNYVVRPLEEADLESRFGDAYRRYRSAVRCWCPRCRVRQLG
ncbi:methyltransferase family protein [Agromyces subbeticus]|uniref:methyltransferase family protein n=1 Tax=Agromyces subbeticus TaxID=293890 RepID=UPI0003B67DD5|nr:isoprenylcysteine carboxylmethyltransferase family protein [Agromyces subbeticus]